MKQNEITLNTMANNQDLLDELDYEHNWNGLSTPLRNDAQDLSPDEKISKIQTHFRHIMETLGMDLTDESLQDTPKRVAKMFVNEVFKGLRSDTKPEIKLFKNNYKYQEMLVERDITVYSYCEHHFVPIIGKAHVAYISNGNVIGLSKINRLVEYYAKRPQVQERLNEQIARALKEVLNTEDVAVVIDAEHLCVKSRGIQDTSSSTVTASYHGQFKKQDKRNEFLTYLNLTSV
ncbi:MAG: GTP cyclohydrolase I FolE [Salibacteraceae bacterium]